MIYTKDYAIDKSGKTLVTEALQKLIDEASIKKTTLVLSKGIYQTAALFLKSDMVFHFEEGSVLLGTTDETQYTLIETRVAGIDMDWYPGVLNCLHATHVKITGFGTIDGQGAYYWHKYWGKDTKGGMRKTYDEMGLRWACDYDCMRVRNLVVADSTHILLKDFTSKDSGFWNVHVLYSNHIHVDGIKITSEAQESPSTDGIDIDSCQHVLVENCLTSCNDDSICIKSGRDYDGYHKAIPSYDITVRNCQILSGFGVTIGSEVSGGIYDIHLENLTYLGTDCGFRIKSSTARKGYIRDIYINNLNMHNVKYAFHMYLNWNPQYSLCTLPTSYAGNIPKHWEKLLKPLGDGISNTKVENIFISNIKVTMDSDYQGIARAFHIEGFKEVPFKNIVLHNADMVCREFGMINYVENLVFKNAQVRVMDQHNYLNDMYDNR